MSQFCGLITVSLLLILFAFYASLMNDCFKNCEIKETMCEITIISLSNNVPQIGDKIYDNNKLNELQFFQINIINNTNKFIIGKVMPINYLSEGNITCYNNGENNIPTFGCKCLPDF